MSQAPQDTKGIFLTALEIADAAERAAFVERCCGDDAALGKRVNDLLRAYEQAGGPLDKLVAALASTEVPEPIREHVGATIGPYKLMEQIGEGGFGLVFVAEQERPIRRKVALKIIKPGMDTRDVIARFEAERQALALMEHPNIARVLDAGTTESGRPYFVMELVRGVPITEYCDKTQLTPRERLELFVEVCHALQHAHQKGIIHRDIKPSNVLVTLHDGRPVVKVIDFGVAKALHQKLTEQTIYTRFSQMIGTPLYMSPEQAEMSGLDIDTRSDVYSLGVLMYELLTGTTPFDKQRLAKAAYLELIRIIREEQPPKPSTRLSQSTATLTTIAAQRRTEPAKLSRIFRGDLDWITMKALEKDRTRRYGSARELAEDIERWERGDPIVAKPPTLRYLLGKYVRRNRIPIAVAAAVLVALIGGTIFEFYLINRERSDAIESRRLEAKARSAAEAATKVAQLREQEAREQKERTEAALKEVERQRKRAEENFRQTRQTVDKYFTLISESRLIDIPGAESLRKELLSAALDYYRKYREFPKAESDDAEIQAELAASYLRMSQIEYVTKSADWLAESEKGQEILERLIAQKTPIEKFKSFDAGIIDVSGQQLNVDLQSIPRVIKLFERGARNWGALAAGWPSSLGIRYDLATMHNVLGNLSSYQAQLAKFNGADSDVKGLLQQSLVSQTKARDLWLQLSNERPDIPKYRAALALAEGNIADVNVIQKNYPAALKAFRNSEALNESLARDFPNTPAYRIQLANVNGALFRFYFTTQKIQNAASFMRREWAVREKMVADFPTVPAFKDGLAQSWPVQRNFMLAQFAELKSRPKDFLLAFDLYAEILEKKNARRLAGQGRRDAQVGGVPTLGSNSEPADFRFPFATSSLEARGLLAFEQAFRGMSAANQKELLALLGARAAEPNPRGAKTLCMAEVVALWWSGAQDRALGRLEVYARQMSDDPEFQVALARARAAASARQLPVGDSKTAELLEGLFKLLPASANDAGNAKTIVASIKRLDPDGKRARAHWSELLRHGDSAVRKLAIREFPEPAVKAANQAGMFEQYLADPEAGVRIAAAERVWSSDQKPRQVIPVLSACLGDVAVENRSAAAQSLAKIGPAASETLPALFAALAVPGTPADDLSQMLTAIESVDAVHHAAASRWKQLAKEIDGSIRRPLASAIETAVLSYALKVQTVEPFLRETLNDPDPNMRLQSAALLLSLPGDPAELVAQLQKDFSSADKSTRLQFVEKLVALGRTMTTVRPLLQKALTDSDSDVRLAAVKKLGPIVHDPQAVNALVEALKGKGKNLDWETLGTLAATGRDGREAIPLLFASVPEIGDASFTRGSVVRTNLAPSVIRQIDSRGAIVVPKWIELAKDHRPSARKLSLDELAKYGPAAESALPVAVACLKDPDKSVRVSAANLVWTLTRQSDKVIPVLIDVIDHPPLNPQAAVAAVQEAVDLLGKIGTPAKEAIPSLQRGVSRTAKLVPLLAIRGAGAVWSIQPTSENASRLIGIFKKHGTLQKMFVGLNFWNSLALLNRMGPAAREAVPLLFDAFRAPAGRANMAANMTQDWIRRQFVQTLRTIDPNGDVTLDYWVRLLSHEQPAVRAMAAREIGRFGSLAVRRARNVDRCLNDPDEDVRLAAAVTIEAIAPTSAASKRIIDKLRAAVATPATGGLPNGLLDALGEMGPGAHEALPDLITLLARANPKGDSWSEIADAIDQIDPEGVFARRQIAGLISQRDPVARESMLRWFFQYAPWDENYDSNLQACLKDADVNVRLRAASQIQAVPRGASDAIPVLMHVLEHPDAEARAAAADQLASIGLPARDAESALTSALEKTASGNERVTMIHALWSVTHDVRLSARLIAEMQRLAQPIDAKICDDLSEMGREARAAEPLVADFLQQLRDPSQMTETDIEPALRFLAVIDPEGRAVKRQWKALLNSGDPSARVRAIEASRNLAWDPSFLTDILRELVDGPDHYLAMNAAGILADCDEGDKRAIAVLVAELKDGNPQNRAFAAHILASIGPRAAVALKDLRLALADSEPDVAFSAAYALWRIGRESSGAIALVRQPLSAGQPYMYPFPGDRLAFRRGQFRFYAEDVSGALQEMGSAAQIAAERLIDALPSSLNAQGSGDVSLTATVDPEGQIAIPAYLRLLQDARTSVRSRAAAGLGFYGPKARSAESTLRAAMGDSNVAVRAAAADALWQITHRAADVVPVLVALLKAGETQNRQSAIKTLQSIGSGARAALDPLSALFTDPSIAVRVAAARATWKIGGTVDPIRKTVEIAMQSRDPGGAIKLVEEIGAPAAFAVPMLTRLAERSGDVDRRVKAVVALAKVQGKDDVLAALISSEMEKEGASLLPTLEANPIAGPFAVKALVDRLQGSSSSPVEKERIIKLVGGFGFRAQAAVSVLHSLAETTRSAQRRQLIGDALSKIERDRPAKGDK